MKTIRSRSFVVLFVVLLSFSSLGILNVKANPLPYKPLQIDQPKPKTYNTSSIPVSVIIRIPDEIPTPTNPDVTTMAWMKYSLDGNKNVSIIEFEQINAWDIVGSIGYMIIGTTTLLELTSGNHSLTVYAQKTNNEVSSDSIDFAIDDEDPMPTPKYPLGHPEQRPTPFEIAIIVILLVVVLGLMANHFKKGRT